MGNLSCGPMITVERIVCNMTMVLAVRTYNTIVIGVDSLRIDENDKKPSYDAQKYFEITSNSGVLVAGQYFDRLQVATFLNMLSYMVNKSQITDIDDIYKELKQSILEEYKKNGPISPFSRLIFILVGFQGNTPKIYVYDSQKGFRLHDSFKIAAGIDDDFAYEVLHTLGIEQETPTEQIEKAVDKVLKKTHTKYPNEVDKPYYVKTLKPL